MEVTREELESLYKISNKHACRVLGGISNTTLMKLIRKADIKEKGKGNRNEREKIRLIASRKNASSAQLEKK